MIDRFVKLLLHVDTESLSVLRRFSLSISKPSTFGVFHKNALYKFTVSIIPSVGIWRNWLPSQRQGLL